MKSKLACQYNIGNLAKGRDYLYLWTFTFPDVVSYRHGADRWMKAQRDLVRSAEFYGVRVYEIHPGGHGLHIHVVTNRRFDVRVIRGICEKHGFGRINVVRIPVDRGKYISKYITKSRDLIYKGCRVWAVIGKKFFDVYTRVSDIVHESGVKDVYDLLYEYCEKSSRLFRLRLWEVAKQVFVLQKYHLFNTIQLRIIANTGWVGRV